MKPDAGKPESKPNAWDEMKSLPRPKWSSMYPPALGSRSDWPIFQPTLQPTECDVLYNFREVWQSPRSCKLLQTKSRKSSNSESLGMQETTGHIAWHQGEESAVGLLSSPRYRSLFTV